MRKFLNPFAIAAAFVLASLSPLSAVAEDAPKPALKTAIFVNNLGGRELAPKAAVLQAALAAELNGRGYAVLTPEQIAESLTKAGKREEDLGRMLTDNSSARALARTIGADYLLVAHLLGYNKRQVQYQGEGISTRSERYRLRVSYSLLESAQGSGVAGDTFAVESTERENLRGNLRISDQGRLDDMIAEAATLIANNAVQKADEGQIPAPDAVGQVNFTVTARIQDIALPNVTIDDNGRVQVSAQVFPVEASGAVVELDGVSIGSAPGSFRATPGLHQMRVARPGFQDWVRNVNLYEGFNLNVALDFTPQGLRQWKDMTAFIERLRQSAQLTDAEAEAIRGEAQMLRQSGYKVDYKVDTKEAPATVITGGSIWEPVVPIVIQGNSAAVGAAGANVAATATDTTAPTTAGTTATTTASTTAATAATTTGTSQQVTSILIDATGNIYLNDWQTPVPSEKLVEALQKAKADADSEGKSFGLQIVADKDLPYSAVLPAIEAAKKLGLSPNNLTVTAAKATPPTVTLHSSFPTLWNGTAFNADQIDARLAELGKSSNPQLSLVVDPGTPLAKANEFVAKAREHKVRVQFKEQ